MPKLKLIEVLKHITSSPQVSFAIASHYLCRPSGVSDFALPSSLLGRDMHLGLDPFLSWPPPKSNAVVIKRDHKIIPEETYKNIVTIKRTIPI